MSQENLCTSPEFVDVKPEFTNIKTEFIDIKPEFIDIKPELVDIKFECIDIKSESIDIKKELTDLEVIAQGTEENLIPKKSKKLYEFAYERFLKWAKEHNATKYSETVLLAYFTFLSKTMKSSTLWAQYSMIKAELNINKGVRIEMYPKLNAFLKSKSNGYKPKKSRTFTKEQFDKFLKEAPDEVYLAMKVIMIFGVAGSCRCEELVTIRLNDIEEFDTHIMVTIPNTESKVGRLFTVVGEFYINFYKKYKVLRPENFENTRFFLRYENGKCHRAVIGYHKVGQISKEVATYLQLPCPKEYTGYCLRRTSANFLTDKIVI